MENDAGIKGLISPSKVIEDKIDSIKQKEILDYLINNESHDDCFLINKKDYSPRFFSYKWENVYETEYDREVGATEQYELGQKCIRPIEVESYYFFDKRMLSEYGYYSFVNRINEIIRAHIRGANIYRLLKNIVESLTRQFKISGQIQLNLVLGSVCYLSPGEENGYLEHRHLGEYYADFESLIYNELDDDMCYSDGSSPYVPCEESIENFIIESLEHYFGGELFFPRLYGAMEPKSFFEWFI